MIDIVETSPGALAEMEMIFAAAARKRAKREKAGLVRARRGNGLADFPAGTSCVYVIGEADQRVVKIGRSSNLRQRLNGLRCSSALHLTLLWAVDGGEWLEDALHDEFSMQHIKGEWFSFPDGDAVERVQAAIGALRG
jgi:hypothetical protein